MIRHDVEPHCVEVIVKVCHPAHPPVEAPDLQAHIRLGDVAYTAPFPSGGLTTMAVTQLPPNHKITYTVAVKDAVGNPAFVADPAWQLSGPIGVLSANPPIPEVEPPDPPTTEPLPPGAITKPGGDKPPIPVQPLPPEGGTVKRKGAKISKSDGYSITVFASDQTGTASVTFTCDADLTAATTTPLVAVGQLVIVGAGQATVVELVPGTPAPA